jgi:hypothetical protein
MCAIAGHLMFGPCPAVCGLKPPKVNCCAGGSYIKLPIKEKAVTYCSGRVDRHSHVQQASTLA